MFERGQPEIQRSGTTRYAKACVRGSPTQQFCAGLRRSTQIEVTACLGPLILLSTDRRQESRSSSIICFAAHLQPRATGRSYARNFKHYRSLFSYKTAK